MISVTDELGDSIPQYNTDDEENETFDNIPALINADHLQKTVLNTITSVVNPVSVNQGNVSLRKRSLDLNGLKTLPYIF